MQRGAAELLDERERSLDPRVRTVWAIGAAVPLALAGSAAAIVVLAAGWPATLAVVSGAAGFGLAALAVVWARAAWTRWRWRAAPDALDLRRGVVFVRESLVPYHRIQQIDVARGPLERMLGLATLVLRTAAATTDATIPGIAHEDAAALRDALLTRAGVDDAV